MAIEFNPAFFNLKGDITTFTYQEPGPSTNTVLDIKQPWDVTVGWTVEGLGAAWMTLTNWHVKLNVESMGPGDEKKVAEETILGSEYQMIDFTHFKYEKKLTIPAGTIGDEGVYKLVVILTHDGPLPGVPDRSAGFLEGPMLQFYSLS